MKLAIVTYPEPARNGLSLRRDVELVRASILYADEVELVSLGAAIVAGFMQLAAGGESSLFQLLMELDDETIRSIGGDGFPDGWREILPAALLTMRLDPALLRVLPGGGGIDPRFFEKRRGWQRGIEEATRNLDQMAEEMLIQSGGSDLVPAFEAGILKLSSSGLTDNGDSDAIAAGYVEIIKQLLQDPSKRLLFDDRVGGIVRSLVDEGHVEPSRLALRHAGEAAVGSGLVARLPAFPEAPLDELLDLRRDMSTPLTRYRRAVAGLADRLTFHAFDVESPAEIDDLWITDVAPTLLEIKEGLAEHGLVRELQKTIGADMKTFLSEGAAVYIGLGSFTSVNDWIASTVAIAGPAMEAAAKAATARRSARADLRGRELFYLYELNRRIR